MSSIYKKGRPSKSGYDDTKGIPKKPGEYRIKDKDDNFAYIGETNNLRRRVREHKRTGKFQEGETVDYMVADGRSTSRTRRAHEQRSIEKHAPYRNKSVGGEGRVAGGRTKSEKVEDFLEDPTGGTFIGGCLFTIAQVVFVLLMLAIAALIVYEGWDLQLMVWPLGFLGLYILLKKFVF